MIDFILAMMAAGVNSADGSSAADDLRAAQTPPAIVAPATQQPQVAEVSPTPTPAPAAPSASVNLGENVIIGQSVLLEGVPATPTAQTPAPQTTPEPDALPTVQGFNMAVVPAGLLAEPQTPSGKFTTAAEVKPILNVTKGSWIAVREYEGQDLLYVTHLWSWRCGLHAMAISINDEPMQNWPLPPCHMEYTTPAAILEEDGLPYLTLKSGSVRSVDIQVVYDDLSMDAVTFQRGDVLIP